MSIYFLLFCQSLLINSQQFNPYINVADIFFVNLVFYKEIRSIKIKFLIKNLIKNQLIKIRRLIKQAKYIFRKKLNLINFLIYII